MMKLRIILSALFFMCAINSAAAENLSLPAIFSSNMVLQRSTDVTFWGQAKPNSEVEITASWDATVTAESSENGSWTVQIATPEAGGPYTVEVNSDGESIKYENVLIGEVWLCSGQSNMEMPLKGWLPSMPIFNSEETIAYSENSQLRLFTVARAYAGEPKSECSGTWVESNPETTPDFSATAYYFGKKLTEILNVPVGLIHSSWGGTPVEAWTSKEYLKDIDQFKELLANMKDFTAEVNNYIKWLEGHKSIDVSKKDPDTKWKNLGLNDALVASQNYSTNGWSEMNLPTLWEGVDKMGSNFDGVVWFKKDIEIPESWLGQDLVIELGPIDDMDITYVNGQEVGETMVDGFYSTDRFYDIPAKYVKDKDLHISVRVLDTQGGGGLFGKAEQLNIHPKSSEEKISLAGAWKYLPVAEYRGTKFYLFDIKSAEYFARPKVEYEATAYTATALYNGMISPLIPYTLRGAIWYQGEANVGDPKGYEALFPLMIKNWREDWGLGDFPFYYAQIAPYNYGDATKSQELRDAQRKSMYVPNTGMAVTLDIGNSDNIHPGDKQAVGDRLARWALVKTYNVKNMDYSGPLYKSLEVKNGKAVVSFECEKMLIYKPEAGTARFCIAGADKVYKEADVRVDGDKLILSNSEVTNPVSVRYGWGNTSTATLFDENGLPASSFSTEK